MRFLPILALLAALPLGAQEVGYWSLELHANTGTLAGHFTGSQGGQPFFMDLKDDLGVVDNGFKVGYGYGLEYQGPRHALMFTSDTMNFTGSNKLTRDIIVNGTTYPTGGVVTSTVKTTIMDFTWTIRQATSHPAWVGIDLGARSVGAGVNAQGPVAGGASQGASYYGTMGLPQIGLSAGFQLDDGTLVARAYAHAFYLFGASYNVYGADIRYFPAVWGGVRVFANVASLKVPSSSVWSNLDLALDQSTYGLGGVLRF